MVHVHVQGDWKYRANVRHLLKPPRWPRDGHHRRPLGVIPWEHQVAAVAAHAFENLQNNVQETNVEHGPFQLKMPKVTRAKKEKEKVRHVSIYVGH